MMIRLLAVLCLLPLAPCAVDAQTGEAVGPAGLPQSYRVLLIEADHRQDGDSFLETADMVAVVAPGGRAAVHAAILQDLPHRAEAFADWPLPQPAAAAPPANPTAPAEPEPRPRDLGGAPVVLGEAPEGSGGWLGQSFLHIRPDSWAGQVRFGVQLERGNSDLTDYSFALELDREFQQGWSVNSQFEYFYTDSEERVTRDNWLVEGRLARELDSGLGYYAGGSYERDRIGLYDASAFITAGGIWHALDSERFNWVLRAGVGQRYRDPADGGAMLTDWVAEAGSEFTWHLSESAEFASETTVFAGGGSRIDQRFTLTSRLAGDWAVQTDLRVEHEFETPAGREPTDTRLGVSLLRAF